MNAAAEWGPIALKSGDRVSFSKTLGESDIYLFAGITADFSPNHVDRTYMAGTRYGDRIAHGALLVGFMSTVGSLIIETARRRGCTLLPVSLGYDRVRFLAGVTIGSTLQMTYTVEDVDQERLRMNSAVEVWSVSKPGADPELAAVATHIMRWLEN